MSEETVTASFYTINTFFEKVRITLSRNTLFKRVTSERIRFFKRGKTFRYRAWMSQLIGSLAHKLRYSIKTLKWVLSFYIK